MVELIVVMILIGILGAIGASRFFNRSGFDVPAFADQAGTALRFAQKEAIAQNRPVYARFDGASISLCYDAIAPWCSQSQRVVAPFSVSTDSTYCTASDWYCLRAPANVSYTVARGGNLTLPSIIGFDALGRPIDTSQAPLGAATTLAIGARAESATVTVEPETGYVH